MEQPKRELTPNDIMLGLLREKDRADQAETEVQRLRSLLGEAAWYVDHYGDYRKDRQYYLRFKAAADGKPEPSDDELYGSEEQE